MARKRYRPEVIFALLRLVEGPQSQGMVVAEASRRIGVSEPDAARRILNGGVRRILTRLRFPESAGN